MENKIKTFKDLNVWQKGVELVAEIYRITKNFPKDELYGLSAQMRRASISIPSNIAEGFRRRYGKEHKQFLSIALGSSAELETQVVIAKRLRYITDDDENDVMLLLNHVCGMIVNLDRKIV